MKNKMKKNKFLEIYLSIIENENEKKNFRKPFLGYCPNYIMKKENCIARFGVYCDLI